MKCTTSPRTTHTAQYQFYQIFIPISNAATSQYKDNIKKNLYPYESKSNSFIKILEDPKRISFKKGGGPNCAIENLEI